MRRLIGLVGALLFGAATMFGQSAGAVRTQEVFSSTGHVKIDNSLNTAVVPVTYAASTTFNGANGDHFEETLTGDVTSVTLTGFTAGTTYSFKICQDSTGSRVFTPPSTFVGWQSISTVASTCTTQIGYYDGTNVNFPAAGQSTTSSTSTANGLIAGCGIFYSGTGLIYSISACDYQIGGVAYHTNQTNVTLAASDPSNDRIDVFYVDNTGTAAALTGTASSVPVEPSVDPATQINIGFVTVTAGSTSPSGVTTTVIYKEDVGTAGGEWDCTLSGTDWLCNSTGNPYQGTKSLLSSGLDVNDYVKLTASAAADLSTYNVLSLYLDTVNAWSGKNEIWITWYNGTTPVGNTVFTSSNTYGWNGSITATYQLVVIPMSSFNLGSSQVDSMRIMWNTGGKTATGKTIYIDNIILQHNDVTGGTGGSSGGVSSVGLQMDGVVFKSTVPGSPVTTSGTLTPQLANANTGYVLAGPIGSVGSNVGIRQFVHCTFHTAVSNDGPQNFSCPAFSSPVSAGDALLVISPQLRTKTGSSSFTDTLGNTITNVSVSHSGSNSPTVAYGAITTSGTDIVSGTNIDYWDNSGLGSAWSQYDFWVYELTGSSGVNTAGSLTGTGTAPYVFTVTNTPGALTDTIIRLGVLGSNDVANPDGGTTTISPVGSEVFTVSASDIEMGFGKSDVFAPDTTSLVTNVATFNRTSGTSTSNGEFIVVDLTQSPSAGSAPWIARRLTPGDLPLTSVNTVNAVSTTNLASNMNITTDTDTTILSKTITMPSGGCPCRVLFQGSMLWTATVGSTAWGWWASDGTNTFGWAANVPTDSTTVPVQISEISPVSYSDNQSVTFSFHFQGSFSGGTITAVTNISPPLPSAARTHMTLTILQSKN